MRCTSGVRVAEINAAGAKRSRSRGPKDRGMVGTLKKRNEKLSACKTLFEMPMLVMTSTLCKRYKVASSLTGHEILENGYAGWPYRLLGIHVFPCQRPYRPPRKRNWPRQRPKAARYSP